MTGDEKRRGINRAVEKGSVALFAWAVPAAFASGFGCALRVVAEIAAADLAALATGLDGTLWIFGKIAFATTMSSHDVLLV